MLVAVCQLAFYSEFIASRDMLPDFLEYVNERKMDFHYGPQA